MTLKVQLLKKTWKNSLLIAQHMNKFTSTMKLSSLGTEDFEKAETEHVQISQLQEYKEEITALQKNFLVKRNSQLYKVDPVLQDGILRVGGRLDKSAMPEEAKHPAILSGKLYLAKLILQHIHQDIGHCGRNYILAQLRQKYWIPEANLAIRKVISKCAGGSTLSLGNKRWQNCLKTACYLTNHPLLMWGLISSDPLRLNMDEASSSDTACSSVALP